MFCVFADGLSGCDFVLIIVLHAVCSWGVLFSHPADFTPVCTTELGAVAKLMPEFEKRNVVVAALSCNSVESHQGWIKDIQASPTGSGGLFSEHYSQL